jgi:ABC-2 type transport system permease protein
VSGRRTIVLVARREIRERLRSRALLYSTALLLLVVGASTAFTAVIDPHTTYDVAVTNPAPPGLAAALQRAAAPLDAKVHVTVVASPTAGRRALDAKHVDAVIILPLDRIAFRAEVDAKLAAIADTAVRGLRRHLPPAPELTPVTIEPGTGASSDAEVLVAMIGSVAMIMALSVYGQWVLAGVIEEKQNRVVEVVISTVRPRHLMAGKVIGIGLLGLGQLALVAGFTMALLVAGAFDAPAGLGGSVALVVPWFGLGFALYAVAYAAAGALASRQQDAGSAGSAGDDRARDRLPPELRRRLRGRLRHARPRAHGAPGHLAVRPARAHGAGRRAALGACGRAPPDPRLDPCARTVRRAHLRRRAPPRGTPDPAAYGVAPRRVGPAPAG